MVLEYMLVPMVYTLLGYIPHTPYFLAVSEAIYSYLSFPYIGYRGHVSRPPSLILILIV